MKNFVFHTPTKLIFGKDTVKYLGEQIKQYGLDNMLLLAGGGSIKKNNAYAQVVATLQKNRISFYEFWGVRPNPVLSHTLDVIEFVREKNIEGIIAVGGGSVIDEAKAVAAGYYMENVWDAFTGKAPIENALPIFTVLTLSGTGSEMNKFAVLTNEETNHKWNIISEHIFPKVSIIDPTFQMTLPWKQTVNGGIDAISHILEYYFLADAKSEDMSLSMNEFLIKQIIKSLNNLQEDPTSYFDRANLCWSATLALNGFSGAGIGMGDWAVHRIEHAISALHPDIAHGAGLAVIFPAWIKYNYKLNEPLFLRWAKNLWDCGNVEDGIIEMKACYQNWGAPTSLKQLEINEDEFEKIANLTLEYGDLGVLQELNFEDIINILKLAY